MEHTSSIQEAPSYCPTSCLALDKLCSSVVRNRLIVQPFIQSETNRTNSQIYFKFTLKEINNLMAEDIFPNMEVYHLVLETVINTDTKPSECMLTCSVFEIRYFLPPSHQQSQPLHYRNRPSQFLNLHKPRWWSAIAQHNITTHINVTVLGGLFLPLDKSSISWTLEWD